MPEQIPAKRKYDSTRRQVQANETKMQIVQAAHTLFIQKGYSGTTIEAIAQAAGVAKETVYSSFQNKRNILNFLLEVSIGGDDQPVRVIDRAEQQAILHDADQRRQLTRLAQRIAEILSRAAPVFEVMRTAAKTEPKINARLQDLQQERHENMALFVHQIAMNGPLRASLDERRAGETVWALASPELFNLLTADLGWPKEQYAAWLADILMRTLLP